MPERKHGHTSWWLIILLLVMWGLLLLYGNSPFFGHHDANGVWLGSAARNLRLYDLREISLVPLPTRGPIPLDPVSYYVNHPPLVVWLSAIAQNIWGDSALSLRLVSIFATMVSLAAFYVFCRRLYGMRMGRLCVMLYGLTPFTIYFGRMPNHESLALAFLMLFLAAFVKWTRTSDRSQWIFMAAMAFLGIWVAWADFFFVMFVSFTGMWAVRPHQRRALVLLGGVGVLAVVTIMGFYTLSYPATLSELLEAFIWRTSTRSEISQSFTWLEFGGQILLYLIAGATVAVVLLAAPGVILAWKDKRPVNRALLVALVGAGLSYNVLFRSAAYVHSYYFVYLLPFVIIAAAHCVDALMRVRQWQVRPALAGLFLASAIGAVALTSRWYNPDYRPFGLQLAEWVEERTQPQDLIFTNIPGINPPIEYYAYRKFVWGINLSDAMAAIPEGVTSAVYIDCPSWAAADLSAQSTIIGQLLDACTIQELEGI